MAAVLGRIKRFPEVDRWVYYGPERGALHIKETQLRGDRLERLDAALLARTGKSRGLDDGVGTGGRRHPRRLGRAIRQGRCSTRSTGGSATASGGCCSGPTAAARRHSSRCGNVPVAVSWNRLDPGPGRRQRRRARSCAGGSASSAPRWSIESRHQLSAWTWSWPVPRAPSRRGGIVRLGQPGIEPWRCSPGRLRRLARPPLRAALLGREAARPDRPGPDARSSPAASRRARGRSGPRRPRAGSPC
jgi:hypothetical protein